MTGAIRKYQPGDRHAVEDICYRTGFMGEPADYYWRHKLSFVEMWTAYYLDREPESTYVAVLDDQVIGYLTGCMDTSNAPDYDEILRKVTRKHRLLFRRGTAGFLVRAFLDSSGRQDHWDSSYEKRWPAHLHINLLPEARGSGLGRGLMQTWQDHLRQSSSPGCHLGTMTENRRAVTFFERMGFQLFGQPHLVPGLRGRSGERLHDIVMVWSP